jgi:integrase
MAGMGRRRIRDKHLPQRVYLRRGAYFYFPKKGPAVLLHDKGDRSYPAALRALARLLGAEGPTATLEQLVARYDAEELGQKAEKTQRGRRQEFKPLVEVFGHMAPEDIEPHHVWTYWTKRGRTEQARHEIRALSALLTFARRIGARKQPNPCFGLQLPQSKARDRYVTDEEFLAIRELAPPMIQYAMDLALLGGFDQSTIRRLERRHLTDEGIEFERGKTDAFQLIEWNDELRLTVQALLRLRPQLRRALICNRRGQPYSLNGFQSQWQRVMKRAKAKGLETFHFHDLRAKSASDAESDQEAADRLGHEDVKLTRKVYRRLPRRAIALSILNNSPNIERSEK